MTPIWDAFWTALHETVQYHQKKDSAVVLNEGKYNAYKTYATELYNTIKDTYMKPSVDVLDRHKVAAVMIVAAIECDVIEYHKTLPDNHIFLGCEMFSTEVALAWMLDAMNKKLKDSKATEQIETYIMPEAFACTTTYFDIFSRNLYYARRNYQLNPLDIAEKLFLLEYITILKNEIDPVLLFERQ